MFRASSGVRALAIIVAAACVIAISKGADQPAKPPAPPAKPADKPAVFDPADPFGPTSKTPTKSADPFAPNPFGPDSAPAKPAVPAAQPVPRQPTPPQPASSAAPLPMQPADEPSEAAWEKTPVERALDEPAHFDFEPIPCLKPKEVVESIANRHKIRILFDERSLNDAGETLDEITGTDGSGMSLRSALRLMLAKRSMVFVPISEDTLSITTADQAKTMTAARIYPVRDLISPPGSQNEFAAPRNDSGAGSDEIIELITSIVVPSSWDSNGGLGSIAYVDGALAIAQSDENHRQISRLLADLRTVRKQQARPRAKGLVAAGPEQPATTERIRKALDTVLDMDFTDAPLKEVVDFLHNKLKVPVLLDAKAFGDAGITPATPFTISLKRIRAGRGLRWLLARQDLKFVVEDDVLLITTADVAKTIVHTRVFPVGDLCGYSEAGKTDGADFDSLIEMITGTIAPPSWDSNGGNGSIAPSPTANALVCSQTDDVLDQIAAVLAQLRANGCRFARESSASQQPHMPVARVYLLSATDGSAGDADHRSQQLIGLVKQLIEPKSWADPNVFIGPAPGAIVVRQTPEIQSHIQQFLQVFGATAFPPPQPKGRAVGFSGGSPLGGAFSIVPQRPTGE